MRGQQKDLLTLSKKAAASFMPVTATWSACSPRCPLMVDAESSMLIAPSGETTDSPGADTLPESPEFVT